MTIELWSIAALSFMLLALTLAQGSLIPVTQGLAWGLGSRDDNRDKTALQGRFARTIANHIEAMLIFVPLMLLVIALDKTGSLTWLAAWLVIVGRTAFIVFYLSGTFGLRSLSYGAALLGTMLTGWALLAG